MQIIVYLSYSQREGERASLRTEQICPIRMIISFFVGARYDVSKLLSVSADSTLGQLPSGPPC